ncbi:MAG: hypothetical protein KatS3mg115_1025 [Candidatus Poribacteria bacterium]|nr:MAG: hypothetical protein KatS3mg115_1025 [Candidatus Poribacteria bacterium]
MAELRLSIRETMAPGANLMERFQNLRRLGFDGIEITASSRLELADEILRAKEATGIQPTITSAGAGCLIDPRKEERDLAVQSHREAIELAARIGAVGVLTVPGIKIRMQPDRPRIPDLRPLKSTPELEFDLMVALYGELADYAQQHGVFLIIEPLNRYEQYFPRTLADGIKICQTIGSPHCKIMADLFHMNIEEAEIAASLREAGDYLANVHLADSNRQTPGRGHTDFLSAFRALKEIGYSYFCGLECGVPGDQEAELSRTVKYLRETWERA